MEAVCWEALEHPEEVVGSVGWLCWKEKLFLRASGMALGAVTGIAGLTRLPPILGSLSCQVDDAQSLVTQISSTAKGK